MGEAKPKFVLDSFAVLAWLQGEEGARTVSDVLRQAEQDKVLVAMCLVNLGEVLYIVEREESLPAAQRVLALIDSLPVRMYAADRALVMEAAHAKARYRMSYADCFALALAKQLGATVLTGAPEFRAQSEVELTWLGE